MNLEKQRGSQNTIKKLVVDDKEIRPDTYSRTNQRILRNSFQNTGTKNWDRNLKFFSDVDIPKLSENQTKLCEEHLTEKDLYNSLKSMQSDKYPGNDGLTKEFYETFWSELKETFVDSVSDAKEKEILSTSQRQAIIKLIEKKG